MNCNVWSVETVQQPATKHQQQSKRAPSVFVYLRHKVGCLKFSDLIWEPRMQGTCHLLATQCHVLQELKSLFQRPEKPSSFCCKASQQAAGFLNQRYFENSARIFPAVKCILTNRCLHVRTTVFPSCFQLEEVLWKTFSHFPWLCCVSPSCPPLFQVIWNQYN